MGRIFETRKATMFARWDKMAKAFTRIGKDIAIAVKAGGPSPDTNPALRRVIQNARAANMPKDKIENAIKKASGQGAENYDIVLYEGYAPHGIAVMVETATNNVVRTVANVRSAFKTYGGSMGTEGSVAFQFKRMGVFRLAPEALAGKDLEALELDLIDHGLEEMGEGTGEKGEPQTSSAARSPTSASCRRPSRRAASPCSPPSPSTSPRTCVTLARGQGDRGAGARRRARAGRGRPARLPQPRARRRAALRRPENEHLLHEDPVEDIAAEVCADDGIRSRGDARRSVRHQDRIRRFEPASRLPMIERVEARFRDRSADFFVGLDLVLRKKAVERTTGDEEEPLLCVRGTYQSAFVGASPARRAPRPLIES